MSEHQPAAELDPAALAAFAQALDRFCEDLTANFAALTDAQPEDQLKAPVSALVVAAGAALGVPLVVRTEVRVDGVAGRPDLGVDADRLPVGQVELKAPGKGADPSKFSAKRDRDQFQRFSALPNLAYTDGQDWRLFRSGELVGDEVSLAGNPTRKGAKAVGPGDAAALLNLLADFLRWEPSVPSQPRALAAMLAPLTRLLRDEVLADVKAKGPMASLAGEWRQALFPDADDKTFADAYAQTFTYALLLAKLEGAGTPLTAGTAADALDNEHALLAQVLRVLSVRQARAVIELPVSLLERVIDAVDSSALSHDRDPWLWFYEDFLAEYDPQMRNDRGVFFTPQEVVSCQVRLCDIALRDRLGLADGFAQANLIVLDPGAGTGTYPLTVAKQTLDRAEAELGPGIRGEVATRLAAQLVAFELLVGSYAVAHLRLTQALRDAGATMPEEGVRVYLTDTLSPAATEVGQQMLFYAELAHEQELAGEVKKNAVVTVCLGNPPYDRDTSGAAADQPRKGGWVRHGHPGLNGGVPLMDDLIAPLREAGKGAYAQVLYNDYVYFWRWAIWKVAEQYPESGGIVSYISASSYLSGIAFGGLRRLMRTHFDQVWLIDLGGDHYAARKSENVFAIRTPVAIAVAVRYPDGVHDQSVPAQVFYRRIEGTSEEKLAALDTVTGIDPDDPAWVRAPDGWDDPFVPPTGGQFAQFPLLTDLFPWQVTGCQYYRSWPIAETPEVLSRRWAELAAAGGEDRGPLLKESRDRRLYRKPTKANPEPKAPAVYKDLLSGQPLTPIVTMSSQEPMLAPVRYTMRSFDRQWALPDARVGDFIRPFLWQAQSDRQLYLTTITTPGNRLGAGPATVAVADMPDAHSFCGRGDKSLMPLWKDAAATSANVTTGLLHQLGQVYGFPVSAEDLFAYVYAVTGTAAYTQRWAEELVTSAPRVPLTADGELFTRAVALGRDLVWWATYATRMAPVNAAGQPVRKLPPGTAKNTVAVPGSPEQYPDEYRYDEATQTLFVGEGQFAPVTRAQYDYEVSGLHVVWSWLGYRMAKRAGKASSPLDDIRPDRWTFSTDLLDLLAIVEHLIAAETDAAALIDDITAGDFLDTDTLPSPTATDRAGTGD